MKRIASAFRETSDHKTEIATYEFDSEEERRRATIALYELHLRNADALLKELRSGRWWTYPASDLTDAIEEIETSKAEDSKKLQQLKQED